MRGLCHGLASVLLPAHAERTRMEPRATSLDSLDEGHEDDDEDIFRLDAPIEEVDEDDEDDLLEDDDEEA